MRTEIGLGPLATIRLLANLMNLEPPGFGGVELVAWSVSAVCKIGDHRTGVVRPL